MGRGELCAGGVRLPCGSALGPPFREDGGAADATRAAAAQARTLPYSGSDMAAGTTSQQLNEISKAHELKLRVYSFRRLLMHSLCQ